MYKTDNRGMRVKRLKAEMKGGFVMCFVQADIWTGNESHERGREDHG